MPKHIIIHAVSVADGIGDLAYFCHWLKLFRKHYKSDNEFIVLDLNQTDKVYKYLHSLYEVDPIHPIFDFLVLSKNSDFNQHQAEPKKHCIINVMRPKFDFDAGAFIAPEPNANDINFFNHFFGIDAEDYITTFYISLNYNFVMTKGHDPKKCRAINILELDGGFFRHYKPNNYLGLGANNLGLLTDPDGITGKENLLDFFHQLSDSTKENIFTKIDISFEEAKFMLTQMPSVFAYFEQDVNPYVLHSVLMSELIQSYISAGTISLFYVTGKLELKDMPESIQLAFASKQIRLVFAKWLDEKEYRAVNGIFLNQATFSIVIPSGDNSLSACFKAGKLPFYAHKVARRFVDRTWLKTQTFMDLVKIMDAGRRSGILPYSWAYEGCYKLFKFLSSKYITNPFIEGNDCLVQQRRKWQENFYAQASEYLTQSALDYFRDHVAPLVMQNYDFETRSLPQIIVTIKALDRGECVPIEDPNRPFGMFTYCWDGIRNIKQCVGFSSIDEEESEEVTALLPLARRVI